MVCFTTNSGLKPVFCHSFNLQWRHEKKTTDVVPAWMHQNQSKSYWCRHSIIIALCIQYFLNYGNSKQKNFLSFCFEFVYCQIMAGTNNHLGYQLTFQLLSQLNSTICFMKWQWQMLVKLNHYQNSCLCSDEQLIRKWNFVSAFQKLMNPIIILISGIMYSFTDQLTMRLLIQHKISFFLVWSTKLSLLSSWVAADWPHSIPRVVSCTRNDLGFDNQKQKNGLSNIPEIHKGTFLQTLQEESLYFSTKEILSE